MSNSLIRGKYVICEVDAHDGVKIIPDGAVYQQGGVIVDIGEFQELSQNYPGAEILGEKEDVVMPGFINAHHHIGLTSFQRGVSNAPLEIWSANMLGTFGVDQYLDTLYSAFEMIESGITTVQHIHGWMPGSLTRLHDAAVEVLRAYRDVGMRVSYSHCVRDQNYIVYEADQSFLSFLPEDLASRLAVELETHSSIPTQDYFTLFEELYDKYHSNDLSRIQLAPANLHWCSDRALEQLQIYSERYQVPLHMHLLETRYQKEYANRRGKCSAVQYLHDRELLGSRMTLGHGTWVTREDIEMIAATGTHICHNCSSNLCLGNGIMPLNHYRKHGVNVAIGIDGAGINDDRDMLQEMRLVQTIHRVPSVNPDDAPNSKEIFKMATENGAYTTPYGEQIGTIREGNQADLIILDWQQLAFPYLDRDVPLIDAIVHRGRSQHVKTVIVGGQPIYRDWQYVHLNKEDVLRAYSDSLKEVLTDEDIQRRELLKQVVPYVREYFEKYSDAPIVDWMLN